MERSSVAGHLHYRLTLTSEQRQHKYSNCIESLIQATIRETLAT